MHDIKVSDIIGRTTRQHRDGPTLRRAPRLPRTPAIYDETSLGGLRKASKLTRQCLNEVAAMVAPGITTRALDEAVRAFCLRHGVVSATYGYNRFPAHCCTSVNHVAAHGLPNDRKLDDGDVVSIDVALLVDGWYGDTCGTYVAGRMSPRAEVLLDVALTALEVGIEAVKPGSYTGDIGHAIKTYVDTTQCSVVHEFGGHGIGRIFHDYPNVPSASLPGQGCLLQPGMCFTIEPIVNFGNRFVKELKDGSIVTRDRSLSAQFEHTIYVNETGYEILTGVG